MSSPKAKEKLAIEAVAKHLSAKWETGDAFADAYLTAAGKRIAVSMAVLRHRSVAQPNPAKFGLRFDRVATKVIEGVKANLGETVPKGMTVVLTITAPILLPSKTITALQDKIKLFLRQKSRVRDDKHTVYGNRIRIRLLRDKSGRAPKMIGFVHNPDSDSLLLINMTREFLERISTLPSRSANDRWLVLISPAKASLLEAYRAIDSQVRKTNDFEKTLMVFGDGRVGTLGR